MLLLMLVLHAIITGVLSEQSASLVWDWEAKSLDVISSRVVWLGQESASHSHYLLPIKVAHQEIEVICHKRYSTWASQMVNRTRGHQDKRSTVTIYTRCRCFISSWTLENRLQQTRLSLAHVCKLATKHHCMEMAPSPETSHDLLVEHCVHFCLAWVMLGWQYPAVFCKFPS